VFGAVAPGVVRSPVAADSSHSPSTLRAVPSPLVSEPLVRIALPSASYVGVARLVATGVASRLELPFDTVDDLQLALELALDAVFASSAHASVTIDAEPALTLAVGPAPAGALERRIGDVGDSESLSLRSVLERLVDGVSTGGGPSSSIVLRVDLR
jgi:hypothetical protein